GRPASRRSITMETRSAKFPTLAGAALIAGLWEAPGPTAAAETSLEGYWWPARGASVERMPELTSELPTDGVFIRDLGTPSRTNGDFGGLDVKPAARAEAMAWNPMEEETISNVCKPPSIIYGMP